MDFQLLEVSWFHDPDNITFMYGVYYMKKIIQPIQRGQKGKGLEAYFQQERKEFQSKVSSFLINPHTTLC